MSTCGNILAGSLQWCEGTPEYPGIKRRVYYIPRRNIVNFPQYVRDANGRITSATLTGNFTLADGAKWKVIDVIADKCQVTSEAQGEYPSQTQLNKVTLVHPATGEDATVAATYFNNVPCVFIVETVPGKFRVIGNDFFDTITNVSQDLGQGATGTAQTTIEAQCTDFIPAPFYTGEIVLDEGTVNEQA